MTRRKDYGMPRDAFHYLIILPAVALVSLERFMRELRAERKAGRDRWRVW